MPLKEQLQTELNQALKAGDRLKRSVLSMVITAIKNRELAKRGQLSKASQDPVELERQSILTEAETQTVLAGEVKKRKEAIAQFNQAGRNELAEKEKQELFILLRYLPPQLDEVAIRVTVKAVLNQTGATDGKQLGQIISAVMAKLKGQADGGTVSRIVKEEIRN